MAPVRHCKKADCTHSQPKFFALFFAGFPIFSFKLEWTPHIGTHSYEIAENVNGKMYQSWERFSFPTKLSITFWVYIVLKWFALISLEQLDMLPNQKSFTVTPIPSTAFIMQIWLRWAFLILWRPMACCWQRKTEHFNLQQLNALMWGPAGQLCVHSDLFCLPRQNWH